MLSTHYAILYHIIHQCQVSPVNSMLQRRFVFARRLDKLVFVYSATEAQHVRHRSVRCSNCLQHSKAQLPYIETRWVAIWDQCSWPENNCVINDLTIHAIKLLYYVSSCLSLYKNLIKLWKKTVKTSNFKLMHSGCTPDRTDMTHVFNACHPVLTLFCWILFFYPPCCLLRGNNKDNFISLT